MNNVVSTVIKFVTTGHQAAAAAIQGVSKASGVATRTMATLATSLGSMGGSLGKAASQAANFMMSIQQMGAIGGIIAGAQLAITQISEYFIERANKMRDAVTAMADKVRGKLDAMNKARMNDVLDALDAATTKAKEAASAFDALASSYMKVQAAQNATAKSGAGAAASALTLEKSRAMSGAANDNDRALIGAGYDIRIAKAAAAAVRDEQDRNVGAANDEADIRAKQAKDAASTERLALRALNKAQKTYAEDVKINDTLGESKNLAASKAAKEAAEKAYAEAVNDRKRKEAEATAASERVIQAENARIAAINDATRGIVEAEDAEKRLVAAQTAAAQAELERAKAEKKALATTTSPTTTTTSSSTSSLLSSAKSGYAAKFAEAFDLWRDPEAAAQAVEADKKKSADRKAFDKAVNRFAGKGKIDEYAALMRAGDEEGMQQRLDQWRKSSKFTPQAEQLVKAEAARQNENAADRALEKIEQNTSKLADKLDQLLQVK